MYQLQYQNYTNSLLKYTKHEANGKTCPERGARDAACLYMVRSDRCCRPVFLIYHVVVEICRHGNLISALTDTWKPMSHARVKSR